METLIQQVTEKCVTQARDLKPGDIISQEYLDTKKGQQEWASRDIRLDGVQSAYVIYQYGGRSYLVPVVLLFGLDVRKGLRVRIASASTRPWETMRSR
jgi:hypothetical protein